MSPDKLDYVSIPLVQSTHVGLTLHTNFLQFVGEVCVRLTKALDVSFQTTGKTQVTLNNGTLALNAEVFPTPRLKITHKNSFCTLEKDTVRFCVEW